MIPLLRGRNCLVLGLSCWKTRVFQEVGGLEKNYLLSGEDLDAVKRGGEGNEETVAEEEEIVPERTGSSNDRIRAVGKVDSS